MAGRKDERTPQQAYEDFYLLISAGESGSYPVTIVSSPCGEARGILALDPGSVEIQEMLARIEEMDTDVGLLLSFGQRLFDSLFDGDIEDALRDSLGRMNVLGKGLRLRLRIDPPELANLPWEYLLDPRHDIPIAISPQFTLSRWVQTPSPSDRPWPIDFPLRILVVISSPKDMPPLDVAREKQVLQSVLGGLVEHGQVKLEFLAPALIEEIQIKLNRFHPHVFHFIGHGVFERGQAHLILEDEDGKAKPASDLDFRDLFLGNQDTRLVVLNACQGGATSSADALVGLAPRLMQRGLPSVVAMQHETADEMAVVFAQEFYRSIADGRPVDVATAEARRIIRLKFGLGQRDWGTPVLFMRSRDGLIFETTRGETQPRGTEVLPSVGEVPRLRVTVEGRSRDYPLLRSVTVIGRNPENDICLPLGYVSKVHAEVRQEGGRFVIRDLDSSNGTWFRGRAIAEHELDDGDTLTIGDVELTFLAPDTHEEEQGEKKEKRAPKAAGRIRLWDRPEEEEEPPPSIFSQIKGKLDKRD
jgi:hypothetical protein